MGVPPIKYFKIREFVCKKDLKKKNANFCPPSIAWCFVCAFFSLKTFQKE